MDSAVYFGQRRYAEAERALSQALDIRRAKDRERGHGLAQSLELLGQTLCEHGNLEEGERLAREARWMPPSRWRQTAQFVVYGAKSSCESGLPGSRTLLLGLLGRGLRISQNRDSLGAINRGRHGRCRCRSRRQCQRAAVG
jgi:hypothetical protein